MSKPSRIDFEERYSDDSGVEFAVRYIRDEMSVTGDKGVIGFEHVDKIEFPVSKLDWLIKKLQFIQYEIGRQGDE